MIREIESSAWTSIEVPSNTVVVFQNQSNVENIRAIEQANEPSAEQLSAGDHYIIAPGRDMYIESGSVALNVWFRAFKTNANLYSNEA